MAGTATEVANDSACRTRLSGVRAILDGAPLLDETLSDTIPLDVTVGQSLNGRNYRTHFNDIDRGDEYTDCERLVHACLHGSELLDDCGHLVDVFRDVETGTGVAEGHKLNHL